MRVLFVSYYAPPHASPRSIRIARAGRALLRAGDELHILSADLGGSEDGLLAQLSGALFYRVEPGPLERRSRRGQGGRGGGTSPEAPETGETRALLSKAGSAERARRIAETLLVPDLRAEWIPKALLRARTLPRPDLVVSFSPLFSSVVLGDLLSRWFRAPHVIDYGDPWSYRPGYPFGPWRHRVDRALEGRIVGRAAGIIVTTEAQREATRRVFNRGPDAVCLSNGYDPSDYPPPDPAPGQALRYLGSIYGPRLPLGGFSEALQGHPHWPLLELYGVIEGGLLADSASWLDPRGLVDFPTSIALMREAGALFVVGNRQALQMPSKVFSYMGSGRPILALVEGPDDPMTRLGLGDQLVWTRPDTRSVSRALDQLHERIHERFVPPQEWSWTQIGPRYRRALEAFLPEG